MNILIVEDEWLAVQKLIRQLSRSDQPVTVVGVTDGVALTVKWLNSNPQPVSVNTADIVYFYEKDGITYLDCQDKPNYVVDYTLEALHDLLESWHFLRVNNESIVESRFLSQIHTSTNRTLILGLKPGIEQNASLTLYRFDWPTTCSN